MVDPNGLHTKAFEQQLIVGLVNSTITDLVAKEDVSYDALLGILDRWVAKTVDWDALAPFSTLGIDEIALTKGHRVARHYRDAVDRLRKQEIKRLRAELPEEQKADLKRTLWPMRKRLEDRTIDEQAQLDRLLAHSPALQTALRLREELTTIFETARSKLDGLRRIRLWCERVIKSGLSCFDSFLALLDTWGDLSANYFIDHRTSGFKEHHS